MGARYRDFLGDMPTIGELVDSLDVSPNRKHVVANCLHELGYRRDEQAGEALGALTEPQLQSVMAQNARLNVREINAVLQRVKLPGGL